MSRKRRTHSPDFKAKVALAAIKGDDANGTNAGAAYVFTRSGGSWSQDQMLLPPTVVAGDQFGWDVAIDGDTIVVGAHAQAPTGAVYVFVHFHSLLNKYHLA